MKMQRICLILIALLCWPLMVDASTHHKHSSKHSKHHNTHHAAKHSSKHSTKHKSKHSSKHSSKHASNHCGKSHHSKHHSHHHNSCASHITANLPDKHIEDDDGRIAAMRGDFKRAERAIKSNQLTEYRKIAPTLKNYPLYPYLQLAEFIKTGYSQEDVDQFLESQDNAPLGDDLRAMWLNHLGEKQAWATYLKYYKDNADTKYECYALRAKLAQKPEAQAEIFKRARELWLSDKSQPTTCNPLFDQLESQNGISESLAWQRIILAAQSRQRSLVSSLSRFVAENDRPLIQLWLDLDGNPYQLVNVDFNQYHNDIKYTVMALALDQLARQNLYKARTVFENLQNKYRISSDALNRMNRNIGLLLAYNYDPDALHYLGAIPAGETDEEVNSWRVRLSLRSQDWPTALHWIAEIDDKSRQKSMWGYWEARALNATGEEENRANQLLKSVSTERDYYGVLAATRTHTKNPYQPDSSKISEDILDEVAVMPGIIRARELYILNRNNEAKREWDYALKDADDAHIKAAAQLAHDWAWYDRSILTASRSQTPVDLNIRFPLVHREPLIQQSKIHDIDPAWAFAVVQQESLFINRAQSSVGAIGLMQLMPETAKSLSKELGRRHSSTDELWRPENNIDLGTAYLSKMYKLFGDNSVLATAAYNAGPSRVRMWLPRLRDIPSDIWIETIPFKETRNYVKNVLTYSTLYELQLGQKPSLDKRLGDINASKTLIELEKPF